MTASASSGTAAPSTAAFFTGTPTRVGPILPSGAPLLIDPVDHWELQRAAWLSKRSELTRPAREPAFAARLQALQEMLRPPSPPVVSPPGFGTTTTTGTGLAAGEKGKGKAKEEEMRAEENEPDGGEVVSSRERGGDDELERAMESVLTAFRQGRPLKDPLPLSLVTSLLYASWQRDGTIPAEFLPTARSTPSPLPRTPISGFPLVPNHHQHPGFGTVPPVQRVAFGGEGNGKRKDPLKGSLWRTEKEVASGSDVI